MAATKYVAELMNQFDLSSEKSKDDAVYLKGKQDYERIKREITFIVPTFREDILAHLNENGQKVYDRFRKSWEPLITEHKAKKK